MANSGLQAITVKIPLEDYGFLQRYAERNDLTFSQVVRKAIKMYIMVVRKKKEAEDSGNVS